MKQTNEHALLTQLLKDVKQKIKRLNQIESELIKLRKLAEAIKAGHVNHTKLQAVLSEISSLEMEIKNLEGKLSVYMN